MHKVQTAAAFHGIEALLTYYHLSYDGLPPTVQTLEMAVEVLNEETDLILSRTTLEGDWYRTAAGPFLLENDAGIVLAALPDWRGRYYFLDEGTGRRVYLNAANSRQFQQRAYAATVDFSEERLNTGILLRRFLHGLSWLEGLLLLLWALLRGGLCILMAQLVYRALSNGGLAAGRSGLWQIAAPVMGMLLLLGLLSVSGRRMIRRAAEKGTLSAMPAIGIRLYAADKLDHPAETAFQLATFRAHGEQSMVWLMAAVWNAITTAVIASALSDSFPAAHTMGVGIALVLYAAAVLAFVMTARQPKPRNGAVCRRTWFQQAGPARRLGVEQPFPLEDRSHRLTLPSWIGGAAAAVLLLPMLYAALGQGISLARLARTLLLYIPVIVLPLMALLDAVRAGQGLRALRCLLPAAVRRAKGHVALPPLGSILELKDVTFSYADEETPLLRGVSLRLHPGELVGILGQTGAGKTTLAKLMTGMLQPTGGNIYYGGIELDRYNRASMRRRIAGQQGMDILLTDRVPDQRDARTCVVFAVRPEVLAGCDRVLVLADGILREIPWEQHPTKKGSDSDE